MQSLSAKLTLAFLFVGLVGALLVAFLVGWQTERQFDRYIRAQDADDIAELQVALQEYYQSNGSWDGVDSVAIRLAPRGPRGRPASWQRLTLVDASGRVISSAPPFQAGQQLPDSALGSGLAIEVEGETVGWLLLTGPEQRGRPPAGTRERAFLGNIWRATLFSALVAAGLALVVGAALARTISRPVRDLTVATQAIAKGRLGEQVAVRTQDELGELANSFNRMSQDLAAATTMRRRMLANIAHDLRTPLSALLGYTEALSEGKFEGTPEIYRILHQETQHLQHLTDDLRTLTLADAGELPLHREPVEPRALLERVAAAHAAVAAGQQVELTVVAAPDLPVVVVDEERMIQVLGNLVGNALRHTPPGGQVTLRAEAGEGQVRLQVNDTGSGIPVEEMPRIWERLYRGDRARAQDGSSGLGLPIARSLVSAHGGTITAESEPGKGATFTILLPVTAPGAPG